MYRIDDSSAALALPAPGAAGAEGFFTEGVPGSTAATLVRAAWLNMIQEEIRAVVIAAGLAPSKTTYNQLLSALSATGVFQTPATADNSTRAATTAWVRAQGFLSGITGASIATALGFTPYNASNPSGYISGITGASVATALGFTPYNASNPSGYITSAGTAAAASSLNASAASYLAGNAVGSYIATNYGVTPNSLGYAGTWVNHNATMQSGQNTIFGWIRTA